MFIRVFFVSSFTVIDIVRLEQDVKMSRQVYMIAKLKAKSTPDEILTIAIDGSDQSSYATPYFRQETKDSCKGWKMRMKLIGALVTGRMLMFFTIASNWETGGSG